MSGWRGRCMTESGEDSFCIFERRDLHPKLGAFMNST